jgi:hypothetical protein
MQLAEVRGLNCRLEVTNRDLVRELHRARLRAGQLEDQLSVERASAAFRVGEIEQQLREARAFRSRLRYRLVDGCVRVVKCIPLLGPLLRLARRALSVERRALSVGRGA